MGAALVIPVVIAIALIAMVATVMWAAYRNRDVRSLERAERQGLLGPEGLRHARQRASREWVENSHPADTQPVSAAMDHTIADAWRSGRSDPDR